VNPERNTSNAMAKSDNITEVDVVIFGAGIAGLWTFHHLKRLGYDVLLLEKDAIGGKQSIASQGIIHSGLKFSLAGKVSNLAKSISKMPDIWRDALNGKGSVDLSNAHINAKSQQLLIPKGAFGSLTNIVANKALGNQAHSISKNEWSEEVKNSGFDGSIIFMDEPVLDIPSVIHALAEPYMSCIRKITDEQASTPFKFLKENNITAKRIIFTCAEGNHLIAKDNHHDTGLETQKRPLLQGMLKSAPFQLYAHLVGKTDKPLVSITTHKTSDGELVWYLGGRAAERKKDDKPEHVYKDALMAFNKYLPNVDFSDAQWSTLPIDRVEGKSRTDGWMPDTPTIHHTNEALYCWPTKLTFAPMLSQMILEDLKKIDIKPSNKISDFSFLPNVYYAQAPWEKTEWTELS